MGKTTGKVIVKIGLANVNSDALHYTNALVDTGADVTVIPISLAEKLQIKTRSEAWIKTGNEPIKVGVGDIKVIINDLMTYTNVWISPKIDKVLIGVVVLEQLGLKVNPSKMILEKEQQVLYQMAV